MLLFEKLLVLYLYIMYQNTQTLKSTYVKKQTIIGIFSDVHSPTVNRLNRISIYRAPCKFIYVLYALYLKAPARPLQHRKNYMQIIPYVALTFCHTYSPLALVDTLCLPVTSQLSRTGLTSHPDAKGLY